MKEFFIRQQSQDVRLFLGLKNFNALSGRTGQLVSTAGSGKFLEELNGQIGQINEQLGYIAGQESYAQQIYNPSQYKKSKSRAQAQADLDSV